MPRLTQPRSNVRPNFALVPSMRHLWSGHLGGGRWYDHISGWPDLETVEKINSEWDMAKPADGDLAHVHADGDEAVNFQADASPATVGPASVLNGTGPMNTNESSMLIYYRVNGIGSGENYFLSGRQGTSGGARYYIGMQDNNASIRFGWENTSDTITHDMSVGTRHLSVITGTDLASTADGILYDNGEELSVLAGSAMDCGHFAIGSLTSSGGASGFGSPIDIYYVVLCEHALSPTLIAHLAKYPWDIFAPDVDDFAFLDFPSVGGITLTLDQADESWEGLDVYPQLSLILDQADESWEGLAVHAQLTMALAQADESWQGLDLFAQISIVLAQADESWEGLDLSPVLTMVLEQADESWEGLDIHAAITLALAQADETWQGLGLTATTPGSQVSYPLTRDIARSIFRNVPQDLFEE